MPEGMGDKWLTKLSYAARLCGFTKKESGWTLHSNRHERFHHMYVDHTGFQPPNQHESVEAFQKAARDMAGDEWPRLDAEGRDDIRSHCRSFPRSPGCVTDAYLGSSR
jgi:hypothetical protein